MKLQTQQTQPLPHIFFVEDDYDDRDILADVLEHMNGCEATLLGNGDQLFDHLEGTTAGRLPALMVLDHHLPGCKGHTLVKTLKQTHATQPFPL